METQPDYLELNRQTWNNRTAVHTKSDFYDLENFKRGKSSLNEIELGLLGNIKGKTILHLQCHFGQDTLSLARLGAKVTGIDLSDKAIETARELNRELNLDCEFICCNLYDLPQHLSKQFDIVFTSYGTIGWLPDLNKWAEVITRFMKPGGKFVFIEFHPVMWMFDDDFKTVGYNYFNTGGLLESESGTYADRDSEITTSYYWWNHSLAEVMQALIRKNLQIDHFEEYDYSPYNAFRHADKIADRKYRVAHLENKIPMTYSLVATFRK